MTFRQVEFNMRLKSRQKNFVGQRLRSFREEEKRQYALNVLYALLYPDLDHTKQALYAREMLLKGTHQPRQYSPYIQEIKFAIKHYKIHKQLQLL